MNTNVFFNMGWEPVAGGLDCCHKFLSGGHGKLFKFRTKPTNELFKTSFKALHNVLDDSQREYKKKSVNFVFFADFRMTSQLKF